LLRTYFPSILLGVLKGSIISSVKTGGNQGESGELIIINMEEEEQENEKWKKGEEGNEEKENE
jgi:hypothetical protein